MPAAPKPINEWLPGAPASGIDETGCRLLIWQWGVENEYSTLSPAHLLALSAETRVTCVAYISKSMLETNGG